MASNFLPILNQLHDHHIDFVIVGGVAAALYGSPRVTFNLDVVPSLEPASWAAMVELFWSLGARPRIPESLERIRNVEQVRNWRDQKGMLVLSFKTSDGSTEVELLVGESDHFMALRERTTKISVSGRTFLIASIDDLIAMKQKAGRPEDLLDVSRLSEIRKRTRTTER